MYPLSGDPPEGTSTARHIVYRESTTSPTCDRTTDHSGYEIHSKGFNIKYRDTPQQVDAAYQLDGKGQVFIMTLIIGVTCQCFTAASSYFALTWQCFTATEFAPGIVSQLFALGSVSLPVSLHLAVFHC